MIVCLLVIACHVTYVCALWFDLHEPNLVIQLYPYVKYMALRFYDYIDNLKKN